MTAKTVIKNGLTRTQSDPPHSQLSRQKKGCLVKCLFELANSAQPLEFQTLDILADNPSAYSLQRNPLDKAQLKS